MKNMKFSIEVNTPKERVWEVLWSDQTFRDWANIIDEGSYMEGDLIAGHEVSFKSASGYGVVSKVEKFIPNEYIAFKQVSDIKVGSDGKIERRDKQWEGALETYSLESVGGSTVLTLEQDVPDELIEIFETRIPQALDRIKTIAEH